MDSPPWSQLQDRLRSVILRIPARWRVHWPLVPVLALALLLRTVGLFPTFMYGDDAEYATVASYLGHDPRYLSYPRIEGFGSSPFVSQPPLLLYLFGWTGALVGDYEVGSVLVSVVLGTATVGVVYAIGTHFRGRVLGAIAGVFLAIFPTHVSLSRKAYLDVGLTFFFTLTIFLFILWLERRTLRLAWATGIAMAATVFSKLPGILVLAPLAAGLAVEAAALTRTHIWPAPPLIRRLETRIFLRHTGTALVPLLVGAILYLGLLTYLESTVDLFQKLGRQAARVGPGGASSGSARPWHWYMTSDEWGVPVQLGLLLAVFATIGIVLFLSPILRERRWTASRVTLILWPLAILAFFTLSARKEWFYIVPLTPPAALLAALPVEHVLGRLREWSTQNAQQPARRAKAFAAASLLLIAAPGFAPLQTTSHSITKVEHSYGYGVKDAALLINEIDPDAGQIGTLLGRFTIHFYNRQPTYHWFMDHDAVDREIEAGRVRFMVLDTHLDVPHETQWMTELAARHDARLVRTWQSWGHETHVWLYEFPNAARLDQTAANTNAMTMGAAPAGTLPAPTNGGP
ncbi:MAG TPA: glycosyltransferase family 39 protein [Candidatus Thermoplasmatota archaeon]|nr:glycosyltransferase family 39 protein [Candidatus Thermoplasmatota archaeon]